MDRREFLTSASAGAGLAAGLAMGLSPADVAAAATSSDWPQWRGPGRDSQVLGERWRGIGPDALKQVWRVALQPSYSTPIVSGPRVFVTETRDKSEEVVSALDRQTGKLIWQATWKGAMKVPFFAATNGSWIRCTPAVDDQRVYFGGMKDILAAYEVDSGKEAWRLDCVKEFGSSVPSFGFVASPLLDGDYLYAQAGGGLIKLEKSTGKVLWRKLEDGGDMYGSAFSSPTFATILGKRQLLVQTRKELVGVEPETGKKLWSQAIPAFRGMNILTPLPIGDVVFTSSYGGGSLALGIRADGETMAVEEIWKNKSEGYMSSPVLINGHIYLHLRNRRVVCFHAESGEKKWTSSETFGQYWSMVANGSQILALDQKGELLLINATPEKLDIVERRTISKDETWGHLAVAGREAVVRELNAAAAYRWDA